MISYVERYVVTGAGNFGIEDFEDGRPREEHFFPETQKYRYKCWRNGCGLGAGYDTIEEARAAVGEAARLFLERARDESLAKFSEMVSSLNTLGKSNDVSSFREHGNLYDNVSHATGVDRDTVKKVLLAAKYPGADLRR